MGNRILYFFWMGLFLWQFMACGKDATKEKKEIITRPGTSRSDGVSLSFKLKEEIKKFKVRCMEREGCPSAVGMLVASEEDYAYRCTGFLIYDDVIATSGHCVPKDLRQEGKKCEGRVYMVFPKGKNSSQQTLDCDYLISLKSQEDSLYDYAFFKLKKSSNRKPFYVNQGKRVNFQSVEVWKSNPKQNYEGRIYKTICKLKQNIINSEFFDGPRTAVINYSGCVTRKGNSGAPILNMKGEVIGIHQSSLKLSSPFGAMLKKYIRSGTFFPNGTATNFGCLCRQGLAYNHQCPLVFQSCQVKRSLEEITKRRNALISNALPQYISKEKRKWFIQNIKVGSFDTLKWEISGSYKILYDSKNCLRPRDLSIYASVKPACTYSRRSMLQDSFSRAGEENLFFKRALIVKGARLCKLNFKLNERLQFESLSIDRFNCREGHGHIDFSEENIFSRKLPLSFHYSQVRFGEIGVPDKNEMKVPHCD